MRTVVVGLALALAGCVGDKSSGVIALTPGTFTVSRQAGALPVNGLGTLKEDALREASDACAAKGQALNVIATRQNPGPYIWGNYPRVEIDFSCVAKP